MILNTTSGIVLQVSITNSGQGYTTSSRVPTFVNSKNDTLNMDSIISTNQFQRSEGPFKIDNLCVDITVNTSGSIITAVPNSVSRGINYFVGDIVAVRKPDMSSGIATLTITYVS